MRQLLVACAVLIASSFTSLATSSQGRGAQTIDPRDLSGYWLRSTPRPRNAPPLIEAGSQAMKGRISIPR